MTGRRGLTLIEVVIVMAIIAMALGLAGPRIGAGLGRLELATSASTVQSFIKMARLQAQRTDRQQYVVLDKARKSVSLVDADMTLRRQEELSSTVEIVSSTDATVEALYISPSGLVRGSAIRLRGRTGEVEVSLQ